MGGALLAFPASHCFLRSWQRKVAVQASRAGFSHLGGQVVLQAVLCIIAASLASTHQTLVSHTHTHLFPVVRTKNASRSCYTSPGRRETNGPGWNHWFQLGLHGVRSQVSGK